MESRSLIGTANLSRNADGGSDVHALLPRQQRHLFLVAILVLVIICDASARDGRPAVCHSSAISLDPKRCCEVGLRQRCGMWIQGLRQLYNLTTERPIARGFSLLLSLR